MTFTAKYDGWCGECQEPIRKGDHLEYDEGAVVHQDCLPDANKDVVQRPTCPKCWLVMTADGACGCDPE